MHRVGQLLGHVTARVRPDEVELARRMLPGPAWPLFSGMPIADRRHGLDVAQRLLSAGVDDADLLAAALLHDAAKGHDMRLWHRVAGVLLERATPRLLQRIASDRPGSWRHPFHLHLHHAPMSARAAVAAGCTERCAGFIRGRVAAADAPLLAALRAADEAS